MAIKFPYLSKYNLNQRGVIIMHIRSYSKKYKSKTVIDIDIFIEDKEELYSHTNYSSSKAKCLNGELERYIYNLISSYPLKAGTQLVIHTPSDEICGSLESFKVDLSNHFKYKSAETSLYLKQRFRQWKSNLLIGLIFLATCLVLLEIFNNLSNTNAMKILKESLSIIGWVSLWEPITFILFGWEPILREKFYYDKLSTTPILAQRYVNKPARNKASINRM